MNSHGNIAGKGGDICLMLEGASSVFDLFRRRDRRHHAVSVEPEDRDALAEDWRTVGDDLRSAIETVHHEQDDFTRALLDRRTADAQDLWHDLLRQAAVCHDVGKATELRVWQDAVQKALRRVEASMSRQQNHPGGEDQPSLFDQEQGDNGR